MNLSIKKIIKRLLYFLRIRMGRFIIIDDDDPLFRKAGDFIAADKIEGDYLEFGVYSGTTFVSAFFSIQNAYRFSFSPSEWNTAQDCIERRKLWKKMRFFAFDSFRGLPKPTGIDLLSKDFVEGKFSNSENNFKKYITSAGVPLNRVRIISGWFNETLNKDTINKYNLKHAAIVHIDSDLYESAKSVLEFIKPLLVDGTVIIFDDWFSFKGNPNLGEQRAFREWLDENPNWIATQYQKANTWRNSFIMNKNIAMD
ncbi:MAG: class I SAM-dependent methyltransferase [Deltaproteobacteria bacterium]|nr:class I SAM-dependent methyltransferase [Deltaproteobacteria bacterium]